MNEAHPETLEVWYLRAWGAFHVLVGLLFSVIFILGALVLEDWTNLLYLILSFGLIYVGIIRLKNPYLICTQAKITVTGMFGGIASEYTWKDENALMIKENRFYLNGQKLKFNHWFTNQNQYQNIIRFYTRSATLGDELQD